MTRRKDRHAPAHSTAFHFRYNSCACYRCALRHSRCRAEELSVHRPAHSARGSQLGVHSLALAIQFAAADECAERPGTDGYRHRRLQTAWTKTYGVTEAGTSTPVTPQTLFQAGSISKPVAATGALSLVEHGKLSLDGNVNQYLKTWKVPDNEFTTTQKVTLRRLLSHSAGLTVHGFPGYAVGQPIPTTVQIFNGEKPANTDPIRVDFVPGSKVRYSGGGITIEQQMIVDVSGKPFPEFMHDTVLGPIGMKNSSYQQPLPTSLASLAASGTRADGKTIPGKWHIYPEMAAAGLWTTSGDLATFAINIALSKNGKANNVLSESMTRQMLTAQLDDASLGFFLNMGD